MSNETIKIDIDDHSVCVLISNYINDNFSKASVELYNETPGGNLDLVYIAAGKALLNEAMNIALAKQLGVEEENAK